MAQLHVVNRILFKELKEKMPVGGIFSMDPDLVRDRYGVAGWAGYLVAALARRGIVKLDL